MSVSHYREQSQTPNEKQEALKLFQNASKVELHLNRCNSMSFDTIAGLIIHCGGGEGYSERQPIICSYHGFLMALECPLWDSWSRWTLSKSVCATFFWNNTSAVKILKDVRCFFKLLKHLFIYLAISVQDAK